MEKWQKRLIPGQAPTEEPGQSEVGVIGKADMEATALAQAEEVAWCTRELLATRGWCLWKCSTLGDEVIAVIREDLIEGVPQGYPVYTELELEELCQDNVNDATLRLIHEAKKLARAKVTTKVTTIEGGNSWRS